MIWQFGRFCLPFLNHFSKALVPQQEKSKSFPEETLLDFFYLNDQKFIPSIENQKQLDKLIPEKAPLYEIDCKPIPSILRKVNFTINNINNSYEQVSFELYTNGSLSPLPIFECAQQKILALIRFAKQNPFC